MVILLAGLRNEFVGIQISNKYATYKQNREIYLRGKKTSTMPLFSLGVKLLVKNYTIS